MKIRALAAIVGLFLTIPIPVFAEPYRLEDAQTYSLTLTPAMAGKPITFFSLAPTADFQTISLLLDAPQGTSASVETLFLTRSERAEVVATQRGRPVPALMYQGARPIDRLTTPRIGSTSSAVRALGDGRFPDCGCLAEPEIQQSLRVFALFRIEKTRAQFCSEQAQYASCENVTPGEPNGGGGTGGGTDPNLGGSNIPGNSAASSVAYIQYNRCARGRHGAVVRIDPASIPSEAFNGGTIQVKLQWFQFGGNRRASIKPRSDGGIFPGQALLLAGPVGFSGTYARAVRWNGKTIRRSTTLTRSDVIFYRGFSYQRIPISSVLTGGKGVFDVLNGAEGYSLCATFTRTRQRFNGYTN